MKSDCYIEWNGYQWIAIDAVSREEIKGTGSFYSKGAKEKAQPSMQYAPMDQLIDDAPNVKVISVADGDELR